MIYDSADQLALVRDVLRELNVDEKRFSPKAMQAHISKQKNDLVTPEIYRSARLLRGDCRPRLPALPGSAACQQRHGLRRPADAHGAAAARQPGVRVKYQHKWRYVLVDEFQDTNAAQYELIRLLVTEPDNNRNIFVVGDEDQSIYSFVARTTAMCDFFATISRRARSCCWNRTTAARRRFWTWPTP